MVYCDEENYANSNGEPGPACQAKNYVARSRSRICQRAEGRGGSYDWAWILMQPAIIAC